MYSFLRRTKGTLLFLILTSPPVFGFNWASCFDGWKAWVLHRSPTTLEMMWMAGTEPSNVAHWFEGIEIGYRLGPGSISPVRGAWEKGHGTREARTTRSGSPYAVKDYSIFYTSHREQLERIHEILMTNQQLSEGGLGPRIIGWAIKESGKSGSTLRIVYENLHHRPHLIASGELPATRPFLSKLPPAQQKETLIKILRTLAQHPDPHPLNAFLCLTRDPGTPTEIRVESVFVDIQSPLVNRSAQPAYYRRDVPREPNKNFWSLQKAVLEYFPELAVDQSGIAVQPEEVFPELAGAIPWASNL